jgi:threonyl-tRNA synthetase
LNFSYIYEMFGFKWKIELSTKPENALGNADIWERAESALKLALDKLGKPWTLNPGDGAFYGPKIDIKLYDAM